MPGRAPHGPGPLYNHLMPTLMDARTIFDERTDQTLAHMDVSDFLAEAEERGPADWYVPDQGWHTQEEYQAELVGSDKADIYPLCQVHD